MPCLSALWYAITYLSLLFHPQLCYRSHLLSRLPQKSGPSSSTLFNFACLSNMPCALLHSYVCPTTQQTIISSALSACPNLSTVPHHLRPYIVPSIRRVYLDLPPKPEQPSASISGSSDTLSMEVARLRAENDALRHNCSMWRKRAEVHSAATLGLLEMSRTAKDQIFQLAQERDKIRNEHRKLEHDYRQQQ